MISVHGKPPEKAFVKVEHDGADLEGPLTHDPSELDARQLEVLVSDGLHLLVGVEARLELEDGLEGVERDLDHAVYVVQAVPMLKFHHKQNYFKFIKNAISQSLQF